MHVEALESGELGVGEVASGYQNYGAARLQAYCPHTYQHNLCLDQLSAADIKPNGSYLTILYFNIIITVDLFKNNEVSV